MLEFKSLFPTEAELRFRLEIPVATPSNNTIKGMNRFVYQRLRWAWRMEVLAALGRNRPTTPLNLAFVVVKRECTSDGLDWDNAFGGLKPLFDCLVAPSRRNPDGLGLILDDSPKHLPHQPILLQTRALKDKTTVEIFDISSLTPSTL